MKELLLFGSLFAVGMYLTRSESKTEASVPKTELPISVDNVAYVNHANGVQLFKSVGEAQTTDYGNGREPLIKLPDFTYLGRLTGNRYYNLVEISTTINTATIKYWVDASKIKLISESEYNRLSSTVILPKSEVAKNKLLAA